MWTVVDVSSISVLKKLKILPEKTQIYIAI